MYDSGMLPLFGAYLAGVVIGLWRTDGTPLVRLGLSVLWPIGLLAFVLTVSLLLAASLIAFPLVGMLAVIAAVIWIVLAGSR